MKAAVLVNRNKHIVRLTKGLHSCLIDTEVCYKGRPLNDLNDFDIVFIDPSWEGEIPTISTRCCFYDCEDGVDHFDPGDAYEQLKDKVKLYAKPNYVQNRTDGITNIAFPFEFFLHLARVADIDCTSLKTPSPFFIGSPTFIGNYPINKDNYTISRGRLSVTGHYGNYEGLVHSIGRYDDGGFMYNQRLDWLINLTKGGFQYSGGICFSSGNLTKEWQRKYFGRIDIFEHQPITWTDYISNIFANQIGLGPSGHERWTYRNYELCATGCIMVTTDFKQQRGMYKIPIRFEVKDGQNICDVIEDVQINFKKYKNLSEQNRNIFKNLTPDKIRLDFLNNWS